MQINREFSLRVHQCVAARFAKLPRKGKPNPTEWTVLAAFLVEHGEADNSKSSSSLEVVSLATGNKCLGEAGRSRATQMGDVLNDCHAEVLAHRAFVSYMLDQVEHFYTPGDAAATILTSSKDSDSDSGSGSGSKDKLCLKPGVRIHMYVSQMPCGDCSIFKTETAPHTETEQPKQSEQQQQQPPAAKKPKVVFEGYQSTGAKALDTTASGEIVRSYAWDEKGLRTNNSSSNGDDSDNSGSTEDSQPESQRVGVCRSKPGRGSPTLSMSCSDKIALWNCVGLNGALLAQFVPDPLRLASVTAAVDCTATGASPECMTAALERGLVGRVASVLPGGGAAAEGVKVSLLPLDEVKTAPVVRPIAPGLNASGLACVWTAPDTYEVALAAAGKKMGTTAKSWSNPAQRLSVCKYEMYSKFATLMSAYAKKDFSGVTYRQAKDRARAYIDAKKAAHKVALSPWIPKPHDKEETFYPLLRYTDKVPQ